MKFKTLIAIFVVGGIGGIITSNFVFPYLVKVNFLNTASILNKLIGQPQIITKIEEKTVYIPKSEYFSNAIVLAKDSVVAIQSFKNQKLIKSGCGIVLTRDGLIATLNYVVPADTDSIQIALNGQIVKAKSVFVDKTSGLVLIIVPDINFQVARLETTIPELGKELIIFSRYLVLGKDEPAIIDSLVTQLISSQSSFKISTNFEPSMYGSALINGEGLFLGMVSATNQKMEVIPSQKIYDFLNKYLDSISK